MKRAQHNCDWFSVISWSSVAVRFQSSDKSRMLGNILHGNYPNSIWLRTQTHITHERSPARSHRAEQIESNLIRFNFIFGAPREKCVAMMLYATTPVTCTWIINYKRDILLPKLTLLYHSSYAHFDKQFFILDLFWFGLRKKVGISWRKKNNQKILFKLDKNCKINGTLENLNKMRTRFVLISCKQQQKL